MPEAVLQRSHRKAAAGAGALFLIAMVASLLGGGMLEPILAAPDLFVSATAESGPLLMGVFLELINGIAVVGIAVMLFPILSRYNGQLALGYVCFRLVEAVFCVLAAAVPLSLVVLAQEYASSEASSVSYLLASGAVLKAERGQLMGLLIPIFFSLGAFLLYYVLLRSRLLPRFIPLWGLIGVALVLTLNLLGTLGDDLETNTAMVLALPIITNEVLLGIWLIAKGLDEPAAVAAPVAAT